MIGLGVFLMIVGCGGDETGKAAEWAVEEGALTLALDLLAGDDEEYYFGRVGDAAVGADGQMYVVDAEAKHVKVLGPGGTLRDSVGREGGGPGEFRRISEVAVGQSDSLYVLDGVSGRVSVFGPGGAFAYSLERDETKGADEMMVLAEGLGFVFVYSPASRRVVENDAPYAVRVAGAGGEAGDTLFTARPYQMAMKELDGGMRLFASIPFARDSHFAFGPDERIHYAWNDSLKVTTYDFSGRGVRTTDIPFEPVPVTDDDIGRVLEDRDRTRELVRDRIPSTKPAFDQFFVDDQGRHWFGRPTAHPDTTEWWLAWPSEQRVATTRLSDDTDLLAVQDGFAYGETTTETGAPALVRHRVRTDEDALSE